MNMRALDAPRLDERSNNGFCLVWNDKNFQRSELFHQCYAPRHFVQQDMMLHVVKVGAQVDVDDPGLVLDDRLGDSVYRLMGGPLGPVCGTRRERSAPKALRPGWTSSWPHSRLRAGGTPWREMRQSLAERSP